MSFILLDPAYLESGIISIVRHPLGEIDIVAVCVSYVVARSERGCRQWVAITSCESRPTSLRLLRPTPRATCGFGGCKGVRRWLLSRVGPTRSFCLVNSRLLYLCSRDTSRLNPLEKTLPPGMLSNLSRKANLVCPYVEYLHAPVLQFTLNTSYL